MEKTIDYYMNLPYTIELQQDPDEGWFVRVKELRGCMSQGDTAEEAVTMIQEALLLWLEVALEDGLSIPEPRPTQDYSGKFVVRVPRSLHRDLVETASGEGVSLNQFINVALARAVGQADLPSLRVAEEPVSSSLGTYLQALQIDAESLSQDAIEPIKNLSASLAGRSIMRGWVFREQGKLDDALRSFKAALRLTYASEEKRLIERWLQELPD